MTLSPGTRLGGCVIAAPIGVGGIGEVFRARDTTLNRDAAIKVLPAVLASDSERLARFKREAQVLASLNHPNIAHVYGFEGASLPDGSTVHFLAMELVEGEDLAERLKRGAIPADEAIAIAKQIAEGLEEAHEHGIIHRDLKPANVKVTPDGEVKVLDFGLAKALEGESGVVAANGQLSQSPTMSRQMTEPGIILGTAAYMSPEQARGKPVDKRADIWSFGVVLFEMLTAKRLFEGETVSDTLAAVLRAEVDWKAFPASSPAELRRLLGRCLERDPRNRLHDIADARLVIDEVLRGDTPSIAAASGTRLQPRWLATLPWAVAALAVATAIGLGLRGGAALPAGPPSDGTMIGSRLGPYQITAAIGAGGMGEVFRARDTSPATSRSTRCCGCYTAILLICITYVIADNADPRRRGPGSRPAARSTLRLLPIGGHAPGAQPPARRRDRSTPRATTGAGSGTAAALRSVCGQRPPR